MTRVLVVDDNAEYLEILSAFLSTRFETRAAASGKEGLEMIEAYRPGLVLLDLCMPGFSGLEFARRLDAMQGIVARTPVLIMTARKVESLSLEIRSGLLESPNVHEVIEKPCDLLQLRKKISDLLHDCSPSWICV